GPVTVRSPVAAGSAVARVIVPATPGAKVMASAPGAALALTIACRSDPGPASASVVTRNVAGARRPSSASRAGRADRGGGALVLPGRFPMVMGSLRMPRVVSEGLCSIGVAIPLDPRAGAGAGQKQFGNPARTGAGEPGLTSWRTGGRVAGKALARFGP